MKPTICDYCRKDVRDQVGYASPVELRGVHSRYGGILLPQGCGALDFCNPDCFWAWADEQIRKVPISNSAVEAKS